MKYIIKVTPEIKSQILKKYNDFITRIIKILIENELSLEERNEWLNRIMKKAYYEIDSILDDYN